MKFGKFKKEFNFNKLNGVMNFYASNVADMMNDIITNFKI